MVVKGMAKLVKERWRDGETGKMQKILPWLNEIAFYRQVKCSLSQWYRGKKEGRPEVPFAFSPTCMPFHVPYLIFDSGGYAQTAATLPVPGKMPIFAFFRKLHFTSL
jgi:hypothetical protein